MNKVGEGGSGCNERRTWRRGAAVGVDGGVDDPEVSVIMVAFGEGGGCRESLAVIREEIQAAFIGVFRCQIQVLTSPVLRPH
ncbi:hypothetical protein ACFXTH_019282 [Malus domestica]